MFLEVCLVPHFEDFLLLIPRPQKCFYYHFPISHSALSLMPVYFAILSISLSFRVQMSLLVRNFSVCSWYSHLQFVFERFQLDFVLGGFQLCCVGFVFYFTSIFDINCNCLHYLHFVFERFQLRCVLSFTLHQCLILYVFSFCVSMVLVIFSLFTVEFFLFSPFFQNFPF